MRKKTLERCKEIALAICPTNIEHRCSHVAFLVKSGKIVHIGLNKNKTHPATLAHPYRKKQRNLPLPIGLHSELAVCIKAKKEDLGNYEMAVLRVDRRGKIANSKPCAGCQSVIRQFNVKRTYFSNKNGELEILC